MKYGWRYERLVSFAEVNKLKTKFPLSLLAMQNGILLLVVDLDGQIHQFFTSGDVLENWADVGLLFQQSQTASGPIIQLATNETLDVYFVYQDKIYHSYNNLVEGSIHQTERATPAPLFADWKTIGPISVVFFSKDNLFHLIALNQENKLYQ